MRERVRAGTVAEIKRAAREQLATDGANLSMRAIARELGLVSSALYRYFPSRDELLTALILDAYGELAAAATDAEATADRADPPARWRALCHGIRDWALAHPHEYALLYGTPVPGYDAPPDTIEPATQPLRLMIAILRDAVDLGLAQPRTDAPVAEPLLTNLADLGRRPGFQGGTPHEMVRLSMAWTEVFGALSFEVFGRLQRTGLDHAAWYAHQVEVLIGDLGLTGPTQAPRRRRA